MKLTNTIRDNFIRAAMSDVPKVDYETKAHTLAKEWIESQMTAIFPGVDMAKAEAWLEKRSVYLPGSFHCLYIVSPDYYILKSNAKLWAKLVAMAKDLDAQTNRRKQLKEQLRGCAYSVTTRKALAELLPDFAHYLPDEATPSKMLLATTGVVKAFHAAGWPKKSNPQAKS